MDKIRTLIEEKTEQIAKAIKSGASVEIHASKDGIKIYAVKKTVVKDEK
nr:MAG TPA: hypothetical protein [Caudoviricetes sp.]